MSERLGNLVDQLQEDVSRVLAKQPQVIPADQMRSEEAISFPQMEKQIEKLITDPKIVDDIRKDWQEVMKLFSGGDPALESFRQKYETVYNALEESIRNEQKQMKKCKEYASELIVVVGTTQTNQKYANDYAETIGILKTEIKNNASQISKVKRKEEEIRQKIQSVKDEIAEITKQLEKGIEDIQLESEKNIAESTRQRDELVATRDKLVTRLLEGRNKSEYAMKELKSQEEENYKNITEVSNLKEQIAHLQLEIAKEDARKKNMENEMDTTKKKIDEAIEERDKKGEQINENKTRIENLKDSVLAKSKEKEKLHENVHTKGAQKNASEKEKEKQTNHLTLLSTTIADQREDYAKKSAEIEVLEKELSKVMKEQEIYTSKRLRIIKERKELEQTKAWLEQQVEEEQRVLDEKKKVLFHVEDEIDTVFRNKEEINRDIIKGEEEEHSIDNELAGLQNNLKKLGNHIAGYHIEAQKLNRIINLLEKEQEKYGIDASQAHAKYYQTLEELKIKNNLINELQKKNSEYEAKLKHQQNLYEAVRSDRNLYSKNLLQAHEEIGELTKKYTRMSHQVDQLKDELKIKDADLVKQDRAVQKIVRENEKNRIEKGRVEKNITNTDNVIKDQEEQVSRLKYIISEAQAERTRQHKDYEMVVNERDILGGQLIKRSQELSVLYEKIKIAQSNLAKGESYYREKQREFASNQEGMMRLRKELENTKEQTESIEDLKQEISSLQKDLLNQKGKVKALNDELEIPMNVHRWRRTEAVDPENYERILKIQTLQRRLIAKTEEASEKDQLIKEKEKLYMELKNILARQPGPEIQQELATYKDNLKEKTGQMKKMLGELKESQNQVNVHKFEIERIKEELSRLKKEYFKKRAEEDRAQTGGKAAFMNIGQHMTLPMAYQSHLTRDGNNADLQIGGNPGQP